MLGLNQHPLAFMLYYRRTSRSFHGFKHPPFMQPSLEEIRATLINVIKDQLVELGLAGESVIGTTRLSADLGFSSMDALQLMAVIDNRLGTKLPFETLVMASGQYINDLTVDSLAEFAFRYFDVGPQPPSPM
jgi:acyl carrier protein